MVRAARFGVAAAIPILSLGWASVAHADPSTTTIEQGFEGGEIQHPRAVAMGGAQAATGISTPAIFHNPANLALARVQHFEALGAFGPEARRQSYGGAVADSYTNRVAGGIGGTWSTMDADGIHRVWSDLRAAIAYPLSDRLALGLGGRYMRLTESIAGGPFGASLASGGTPDKPIVNTFTFDAGATAIPMEHLSIGVAGRSLTAPNNGLLPTQIVGGIGWTGDKQLYSFEGDVLADFTTFSRTRMRYMAGGELLLAEKVPLRIGYRFDEGTRTHAVSGGLGYVDQQWSAELGVRRDVAADHPATTFVLGLRFFYDQAGASDLAQSRD
jgi:hypothetical protein